MATMYHARVRIPDRPNVPLVPPTQLSSCSAIVRTRRAGDLRYEGVFVVADLRGTAVAEDQGDDVEPQRAVLDPVDRDEMAGGPAQPLSFGRGDRRLDGAELLIRPRADLDEDERAVAGHHDQVQLAELAGVVADEGPQALVLEESLAAFFAPAAQLGPIFQQPASYQEHLGIYDLLFSIYYLNVPPSAVSGAESQNSKS
jgi:hypothetical protein